MTKAAMEPRIRELMELKRMKEELDLEIEAIENEIKNTMGSEETLIWKRDGEGLHIFLPEQVNTEFPLTFKIRMM